MTATAATAIRIKVDAPHPAQQEILDNETRFNVVACGRRFGKTRMALIRSLKPTLSGLPVAYFAPTYKMLKEFWREAIDLYAPVIIESSQSEHRFSTVNGGSFSMWSLDSADTVRGRKYALALIDEAAMITDLEGAWNKVIRPLLADYEGGADFYSTPKGLNFFHSLYTRGLDEAKTDWRSFHFPTLSNPFIKPHEIDAARDELPLDVFRQEYLAEFIQGEGAVFRNITANLYNGDSETVDAHYGHAKVAGIDWGIVQDFSAISVVCQDCRKELELDRFNQIDWHFQRLRLKVIFEKWNITQAQVELNSIGSPNFEALCEMGLPVMGFTMTAQSKPPLIQSLALALEKEETKWLDHPVGTRELEAYEAKRSESTGRISYNAPSGQFDDTVVARALANDILNRGIGIWI
jgi:hypothetical protein